MTFYIPNNESERLNALAQCRLLDTEREEAFDDITVMAAEVCGTLITAISLIDETRQWIKSSVAVDIFETPRHLSVCASTIQHSEMLVVSDIHNDPRFVQHPLRSAAPDIRFTPVSR